MVKEAYFSLLKDWCDAMIRYQINNPKQPRFHGGLLCPSCTVIHGRCHDGVYPLLYMADVTNEEVYKNAAISLFDWGENMLCDDGSFYNDAQSSWNGITVFSVMSIYHSLKFHGHLLDTLTMERFLSRMDQGARWIYQNITPDFITNINYHATAAAALSCIGVYRDCQEYKDRAKLLAESCMDHISEDGFLYGEGHPRDEKTPKGCRPVDIGYNVEESLPALLTYARVMEDKKILSSVKKILMDQLDFMLPDGGWDNSFGSRNYKWTYWGSRTSDGCQIGYGTWGAEVPVFAEAARRNLECYQSCTHDGLLYGGPAYYEHGELPCIHHTFCHGKALAEALDYGIIENERTALPMEEFEGAKYYPTIDTYKVVSGGFHATVTGYDFEYMKGGHASGGVISLLWHPATGPLLASSMTTYSLKEAHNMQLSRKKREHQPLTMQIYLENGNDCYSQCFDYKAEMYLTQNAPDVVIGVKGELVDSNQNSLNEPIHYDIVYKWTENLFTINGTVKGENGNRTRFLLPVIGSHKDEICRSNQHVSWNRNGAAICVTTDTEIDCVKPIFFLAGGFEAWKIVIKPDECGFFQVVIRVEKGER